MPRTTLAWLAAGVALLPAAARAADEDTQLWINGTVAAPLAKDLAGTLEVSQRFREGGDLLQTRANVDYRLSGAVQLGGGATWTEFAGGHEFRTHQQATLTTGPLAFRTRVEERFFAGADRMELRLRQRVQVTVPVAAETRAALSGELFYIARSRDAGGEDRIEQVRLNATLTRRLSSQIDVGIGYLFIALPRPGAPDRISHVPQLTLTFRP